MIDFTNLPVRNKKFYKTMLRERKERILDFSYQKLRKCERSKGQER